MSLMSYVMSLSPVYTVNIMSTWVIRLMDNYKIKSLKFLTFFHFRPFANKGFIPCG